MQLFECLSPKLSEEREGPHWKELNKMTCLPDWCTNLSPSTTADYCKPMQNHQKPLQHHKNSPNPSTYQTNLRYACNLQNNMTNILYQSNSPKKMKRSTKQNQKLLRPGGGGHPWGGGGQCLGQTKRIALVWCFFGFVWCHNLSF